MNGPQPDVEPRPRQGSVRLLAGRVSLFLALGIVALLAAAAQDIGMAGAWLHPTPRVNSLTTGLGLVPVLAAAVTIYLWAPPRAAGVAAVSGRVLGTLLTVVVGGLCFFASFFLAFFVG